MKLITSLYYYIFAAVIKIRAGASAVLNMFSAQIAEEQNIC